MKKLGRRISIIGSTSSVGKSTLAIKLSKELDLPIIHLDQIYHYPDSWKWRPKEEYMALHDAEIKKASWIIEGNYVDSMSARFEQSETIILLSMNRFGAAWRFIKRHRDEVKGRNLQIGRIEVLHHKFSWINLWYIIGPRFLNSYARKSRKKKEALFAIHHDKLIILHSFCEVDKFVKNIS